MHIGPFWIVLEGAGSNPGIDDQHYRIAWHWISGK